MNNWQELRDFFKRDNTFNFNEKFSNYGRLIAFTGGVSTLIALLFIAPYRSNYHNYMLFFVGFSEFMLFMLSFKSEAVKKHIYTASFIIYSIYIALFTIEVYNRGFIVNEVLGYLVAVVIISSLIRNFKHLLLYALIVCFAVIFLTINYPDQHDIPLGLFIILLIVVIPTNYVVVKTKLNEDVYFKDLIHLLNRNKKNYKLLLNSSDNAIFIFNKNQKIIDLNNKAKQLLKEFDNRNITLADYLDQFIEDESYEFALKKVNIKDEEFSFDVSFTSTLQSGYSIIHIKNKQVKNLQIFNDQNVSTKLLNHLSIGLILFDSQSKLLSNGKIEEWLGKELNYLNSLQDFIPILYKDDQEWLKNILSSGSVDERYYRKIELEYVGKVWELSAEIKVINHGNKKSFLLSIDRKSLRRINSDKNIRINQRILALSNEQLIKENNFLEGILDSNADILIWTMNENFAITSYNKSFERNLVEFFDIEAYEGINFKDTFMPFVRNGNYGNLVEPFMKALKGGRESFIDRLDDKNGNEFWIEMNVSKLKEIPNQSQELAVVGQIINDRVENQNRIKQSLHEKEVLFRELHHRVKNNLQIISSVLKLQKHYLTDEATKIVMDNLVNRVNSMAIIHENLYYVNEHGYVDFKEYVENLCRHLNITIEGNNIQIKTDIEPIKLSIDIAIPCGLIINELITNSIKYAFDDQKGSIFVHLYTVQDQINLLIEDDGKGLPFDDINKSEGLGLSLVDSLIDQIDGELTLNNAKGSRFLIKFTTK